MMTLRTRLALVLIALFSAAAPAYADDKGRGKHGQRVEQGNDQDAALRAMRSGGVMSYNDIRRMAEQRLAGTVIGQDPPRQASGQRWVYDLRVLRPDGEVLRVEMDARDGKVLRVRGKR